MMNDERVNGWYREEKKEKKADMTVGVLCPEKSRGENGRPNRKSRILPRVAVGICPTPRRLEDKTLKFHKKSKGRA